MEPSKAARGALASSALAPISDSLTTLAKNLRALAGGNDLVAQLQGARREIEAARRESATAEGICQALIERHYGKWTAPPAELRLHVGATDALFNFWSKGLSSSD